jgi:hypothetical protein
MMNTKQLAESIKNVLRPYVGAESFIYQTIRGKLRRHPDRLGDRKEIFTLANARGLRSLAVEVGVLRGEFSKVILETWQGRKLYLVDAWRSFSTEIYQDANNVNDQQHLNNMLTAVSSVASYGERVCAIRDLSSNAAALFDDDSLDVVYIDANHSYEFVIQDIRSWWPKVRRGGILAGHDYSFEEVRDAVNEFVRDRGVELTLSDDRPMSWMVIKEN